MSRKKDADHSTGKTVKARRAGVTPDSAVEPEAQETSIADLESRIHFMRHVNHRLKNNLQVIASLLKMHNNLFESQADRLVFLDVQNRIKPMVLAYERLQPSDGHALVELDSYIRRLLNNLISGLGAKEVTLNLSCTPGLLLDLERAIPVGQILVELVTNSVRHAYQSAAGVIRIDMESAPAATPDTGGQSVTITVRDEGPGFPPGFSPEGTHSFGFKLVQMLARQLKGSLDCRSDQGAILQINFSA